MKSKILDIKDRNSIDVDIQAASRHDRRLQLLSYSTTLIALSLLHSRDFLPDLVIHSLMHGWLVAKSEENFQVNEKGSQNDS
jgi:hypothetical protein